MASQGATQRQIALALGVSQPAVCKMLRRVEARVLKELSAEGERQKARQSGQLAYLHRELVSAWERSKGELTKRRQRRTDGNGSARGGGGGGTNMVELSVEPRHGDPRYLEEARKTLADGRRLWGLDAPKTIAGRTGRPLEHLSDEELAAALDRQEHWLRPSPESTPAEDES